MLARWLPSRVVPGYGPVRAAAEFNAPRPGPLVSDAGPFNRCARRRFNDSPLSSTLS
jgi:hypothetical protein